MSSNYSSYTLILNSTNIQPNSGNSSFTFPFTNGNFFVPDDSEICVTNVNIPYSNFNFNQQYNNQSFYFTWTVGSTLNQYLVTIPNSFQTIDSFNNFMELFCVNNGLYLINNQGQNVYYFNFSTNDNLYSVQSLFLLVPTSLPSGWSQPSNFAGYPSVSNTPGIVITNNNFGNFLGLNPNSYGNSTSNVSQLSNKTVVATQVNNIIIRCSLVTNPIQNPSDVIDSFPINTTFASAITYKPQIAKYVKLKSGSFNQINFILVDDNFNNIIFNDPNVLITFNIKCPIRK
jgi:hypothetical protein